MCLGVDATHKVMCKKATPLQQRKTDPVEQSLSELRALRLCRIFPPNTSPFIPAFISRLLSLPGKVFPEGWLWKGVGEKGFCQNNPGREAPRLIPKRPDTIRSLETCPIFPAKEHQKLFIRVAIILSNMGQAEVKSSQNLHIKDEQG